MPVRILIALLAVVFLAAPAFAPAAMIGVADSAQAAKNLNAGRSNVYRTKKQPKAAAGALQDVLGWQLKSRRGAGNRAKGVR
jgi:hypothetical protein